MEFSHFELRNPDNTCLARSVRSFTVYRYEMKGAKKMQVKTLCVGLSVAATFGFAAELTAGEYLEVEPGVDIYYEVHGEGRQAQV